MHWEQNQKFTNSVSYYALSVPCTHVHTIHHAVMYLKIMVLVLACF